MLARPVIRRLGATALLAVLAIAGSAAAPAGQLLGSQATSSRRAPGDQIFQLTTVHKIHVTISPGEWAVLQTSSARGGTASGAVGGSDYRDASGRPVHIGNGFGGYFPWARSDVQIEDGPGLTLRDAGIRYKGNLSFSSSSAAAPLFASFKLKFDVFGGNGKWDGEKTFNLHPGVVDTSKMRETIAYALFRAAGVPAPRTTYAEIFFTVPGVFPRTSGGLFTVIEDVNKTFLERVLPTGNGLLMKPEGLGGGVHTLGDVWSAYTSRLRPDREATPHEQERMIEFSKLVSQTDVALFRSRIGQYLDVDGFLRYIAVNAFIINTDSYLRGGHNFFLYLDPADDRVRFLPWDQDLSLGSRGRGIQSFDIMNPAGPDQPLIHWLLDDPAVATRYRAIVRELAGSAFASAELTKLVDALEAVVSSRDPGPRAFLDSRAAYVRNLVAGWQ
ncbi:MAG TPA: CotH kinase family protein [Vicinamibacterales bacterium]|nr:CotH kinase family protein [Vicinamibacterales bacterium]